MQRLASFASVSSNMAAALSGRCGFFVEKKKRFCKMTVAIGKVFCGEHANMEEGSSRRIPCPLDPKHTVSEDKLDKHLKKCNSREKAKPVYYVENINSGSTDGETLQQVSLSERSRAELQSLLDKLKSAVTGLQCDVEDSVLSHPVLQEELDNPKNGDSAHKHLKQQSHGGGSLLTWWIAVVTDAELIVMAPGQAFSIIYHGDPPTPKVTSMTTNPDPGLQQSSLLGHLEALGLLGRGRCFVEFGAGRGKLSHWIHEALKTRDQPQACDDLQLLLVERSSTRFKVDGKHQDTGVQFERLQVDIQHLDLSKVQLLRQKRLPLVGVGKHLCGAATDLALRCLLETPRGRGEAEPPRKRLKTSEPDPADAAPPGSGPGPDPGLAPVLGLAVALCCHHRCEWRHYVGQQFFLQRGLGAAEFSAFCRMSSWATCGLGAANQGRAPQDGDDGDEEEEHAPAQETDAVSGFLSAGERERVGRLCKRLIDGGRLHFLQTRGFHGKLARYVNSQVTLENVVLTAVPSAPS